MTFASSMKEMQLRMELAALPESQLHALLARQRWLSTARAKQLPPPDDDWSLTLWLCGRGFGKTRTGAEDIWWYGWENPDTRLAVIAPTAADVRDTCFEGESGLLSVIPKQLVEAYNRTLFELVLKNGTRIKGFSAAEPQRLRGPQHHRAWCDEVGAWTYPEETMAQVEMGLRLGENPQMLITTTPIPSQTIKELVAKSQDATSGVRLIHGKTSENEGNVSDKWMKLLRAKYEGTRLGRQELDAEVLGDTPGALWTMNILDETRVRNAPALKKIVVGVDPAVTANTDSDETGIVVDGLGEDDHGYCIADETVTQASPDTWAKAAIAAYHRWGANYIVVEVNNGGDLVKKMLNLIDPTIPVKEVRASVGKFARAEPISMLYEQRKIHHVGCHAKLESQLTTYVPGVSKKSPDRLDAHVWAMTELFPHRVRKTGTPEIFVAKK